MWIGRQPAGLPVADNPAETEAFATAITDACAACDGTIEVADYVAAAGPYGSWLVRFQRGPARQRLVWNGKTGELVLEQATAGIDWQLLATTSPASRDLPGFVASLNHLLKA
jgi:ABC-type nitrate/sulfonate/bicarbonate transport system substrate-binding protein